MPTLTAREICENKPQNNLFNFFFNLFSFGVLL